MSEQGGWVSEQGRWGVVSSRQGRWRVVAGVAVGTFKPGSSMLVVPVVKV